MEYLDEFKLLAVRDAHTLLLNELEFIYKTIGYNTTVSVYLIEQRINSFVRAVKVDSSRALEAMMQIDLDKVVECIGGDKFSNCDTYSIDDKELRNIYGLLKADIATEVFEILLRGNTYNITKETIGVIMVSAGYILKSLDSVEKMHEFLEVQF